jgi:hypothetical protein
LVASARTLSTMLVTPLSIVSRSSKLLLRPPFVAGMCVKAARQYFSLLNVPLALTLALIEALP